MKTICKISQKYNLPDDSHIIGQLVVSLAMFFIFLYFYIVNLACRIQDLK